MNSRTMNHYFNNPIKILHRLKEAGFTESQAEAQVEIFSEYIEHRIATKEDLVMLKADIEAQLRELELRMTIKTGAIVATIVGFFTVVEKFF